MNFRWRLTFAGQLHAGVRTCDSYNNREMRAYVTVLPSGYVAYEVNCGANTDSGTRGNLVDALMAAEDWMKFEALGARLENL